ncbi:MAG TPA: citrate lyase subunit alpha [candidate division Zixibacteria bacterium]|nr:citrate lyase subunit alpha [candidate division Zixibacteria bacterium]
MEFVKNAIGREVPTEADGRVLTPFQGAFADPLREGKRATPSRPHSHPEHKGGERKLLANIKEAIAKTGLRDGMTISFHHHLRNGDYVVNMVLEACAEMGIKDLTIAPSALFPVHSPVIDHIKNGVVRNIQGSMNGPVGAFVSKGGLPTTAILRSHGGRVRAIEDGDLHIDVAFCAAPCADDFGNANGLHGTSACGPLGYMQIDSQYADKFVVITDNLVSFPCIPIDIPSTHVDYVVEVDKIGDPSQIVSGTTRITNSPGRLYIAKLAAEFIRKSPYYRDGWGFQTGAGGISLAVTKFLGDFMREDGINAEYINGGITKFAVDLLHEGITKKLLDGQVFDTAAIASLRDDPMHQQINLGMYANMHSKGCMVNVQDVGFLGATEVDVDFHVNVNTHSDGMLLHGIGGHSDVSAGAKLSMMIIPAYRKRIPVIRESVTTVTTPGETVDVIVCDLGIAINPLREDLIEHFKGSKLPIRDIRDIKREVDEITGGEPEQPKLADRVIALIEYRDGTIIDKVMQVKR